MKDEYLVNKFEDWFNDWDTTKDSEVRRLCGIAFRVARMKSRNETTLQDFVDFCRANPSLRFWQALAAWEGSGSYIYVSKVSPMIANEGGYYGFDDTFYREGK